MVIHLSAFLAWVALLFGTVVVPGEEASVDGTSRNVRLVPPILGLNVIPIPSGVGEADDDTASQPDCKKSLGSDATECENDDANARCIAMSNSQCRDDTSGFSHYHDGDPNPPGGGGPWAPDGCFCVWQ